MAAEPAGSFLRLKVVVTVTTTLPNGATVADVNFRVFTLPHEPLLKAETAIPLLNDVVDHFGLPMDPIIVDKVVESARHLVLLPGTAAMADPDDPNTASMSPAAVDPPLTTLNIFVEHGALSVVGDFDPDDDEDDVDYSESETDSDDDDDDDDDDGGDGDDDGVAVEKMEEGKGKGKEKMVEE